MNTTNVWIFKRYVVVEIKGAYYMSYSKTECGKHFLLASNEDNECMDFSTNDEIMLPNQINGIVSERCNGKSVL